MKKLMGFVKKDDGLVAIEWVGIAAVMLVAAIAIAGAVMTGAFNAGTTVAEGANTMAEGANAPTLPTFP
ncbi:hypothetical protein [Hyphomonas sp. UBA4494]|jgi:hypothetical protein|uniref:hypothetical protein n=1 Tax=Hyphomonas sp. UBA4494 TaxID=1946631 RepID=UPI0025C3A67A|nr:hypothetical protein [Hyphomonas sp. UBA4494]